LSSDQYDLDNAIDGYGAFNIANKVLELL